MPTPYSGSNAGPINASINIPDDGVDDVNAVSVGALQRLEDDVQCLDAKKLAKSGGTMTGNLLIDSTAVIELVSPATNKIKYGPSGVSRSRVTDGRWRMIQAAGQDDVAADWNPEGADGSIVGLMSTINLSAANAGTTPRRTWYIAPPPDGVTITGCTMYFVGGAGHAAFPGGKPAGSMPFFDLLVEDMTLATDVDSNSAIDASATAGAFEAIHAVSFTGWTHVFDATKERIRIRFTSEYGVGSIIGCQVVGYVLTYTQPYMGT